MTDHLTILDVVAGPDGQERIVGIEVMGDADVVDPAGCWGWLRHKRTFAARFS